MGGGIIQLVAYGSQDIYLSANPQVTFFKSVYKRHTNFAIETIDQISNGNIDFDKKSNFQISRKGDLVNKMYLKLLIESDSINEIEIKDVLSNLTNTMKNNSVTINNTIYFIIL